MRRVWWLFLVLGACKTIDNPLYCRATADCTDSARPICDLAGTFDLRNTCIPDPMTCDEDRPCEAAGFPACVEGSCKQCDDNADCTTAGATACGMANVCVECNSNDQCGGTEPICDTAAEACRGCTADDQCQTGACNKITGACAIEQDLIFVSQGGSGTACTRATPCGTLMAGLNAVIGTRDIVMVSGPYTESLIIADFDVTLKASGSATILQSTAGQPVVRVSGTAPVRIEGITIGTSDSGGVRCTGTGGRGSLVLDRVTIQDFATIGVELVECDASILGATVGPSTGIGVTTSMASLTMRGASIRGNADGGVRLDTSDYDLVNNFIVLNGTDGADGSAVGGVALLSDNPGGTAAAHFDFNTVAYNLAGDGTAEGFACEPVTAITFNNNIVTGVNADIVSGGSCSWRYSVFNAEVPGQGNLNSSAKFIDPASNFHLDVGSPCVNQADPTATLTVDVDGEPRPVDGRADIGADERQ
jgi:hypothetical protein